MAEIRADTQILRISGFETAIFQTKIRSRSREKIGAMENAPRSSETVVTPLHGLELGQAWVKNLMLKTLQATQNDALQTTYLSLSLGIFHACSFQ